MKNEKVLKLNNGISVVSKEIDCVESVSLGFWVKAGGVSEVLSNHGISHYIEHMAFKGTATRSAREIAEQIESVGGYLNAYTSRDVTAYHAKVLKRDIELALDILSDIIFNPSFIEDEMEKERNVILQEINQTIDAPDDIIFDHFQRIAFQEQSMGRPILGSIENVSRMTTDDLREYRAQNYTTDSIVFSAAGNVQETTVFDLVQKYAGNELATQRKFCDIKPRYDGGYFFDERCELEQTHVILGYNGVSYLDADYYTATLFSSILGNGMSSRLFQEIREKRSLVYSVYSFISSYMHGGMFGIYAATSPTKLEELLDVTFSEICKMRKGITKAEFERTKAQYRADLLMSHESTSATCDQRASQTILFGAPILNDEIIKKIDEVTIDMVEQYTDTLLSSRPTLVTVGNKDCSNWYSSLTKC